MAMQSYPMNKAVPVLSSGTAAGSALMFAFCDCSCPEALLGEPTHQ